MGVTPCHESSPKLITIFASGINHSQSWVVYGIVFPTSKKLYKSPLLLAKSPFSYGFPRFFLLFLYPLKVSSPSFSPRVPYPECDSMPSRRCASLRAVVSTCPDQDATKRCDIILQCEAPKIAKLVYKSNNYGLWHL